MKINIVLTFFVSTAIFQLLGANNCSFGQRKNTSSLSVYPEPDKNFSKISPFYRIKVYKNGKDKAGKLSYTYFSPDNADKNRIRLDANTRRTFNFSILSFSSPIIVEVTKFNSNATSAVIRPTRLGIGTVKANVQEEGSKIRFLLSKPGKLSIEFNDATSLKNGLMLFANPLESPEDVIHQNDKSTFIVNNDSSLLHIPENTINVLFAPKLLSIGYWEIPKSVEHIYIPGGAWVRGFLAAKRDNAKPLKINGRGVISGDVFQFHYPDTTNHTNDIDMRTWYKAIRISGGRDNLIEGLTITDASSVNIGYYTQNSTIRNVNINGFHFNNDGITHYGNNLVVDNCFFHINEDAIIPSGDEITIKNCMFWQLSNACIQLGWWPHNMGGLNNLVNNCDVIHADWVSDKNTNQGFITAMNLTDPTSNRDTLTSTSHTTENYVVSNIYFDCLIKRFLDIRKRTWRNLKNNQSWSYKNFTFNNIYFVGKAQQTDTLIILQEDYNHTIEQFSFSNLFFDSKKANDEDFLSDKIINYDGLRINQKRVTTQELYRKEQ